MNNATKFAVAAVVTVASFASATVFAAPRTKVVHLDAVVVVAKRTVEVAERQLPTVTVVATRADVVAAQVAAANQATATKARKA